MPPRRGTDFSLATKITLAARVCHRCSNPHCRQPTSGPQENPEKAASIGVAAHIRAASPGGPRYDPQQSVAERTHIGNAIWLCQNCGKLIDSDEDRFPVTLLEQWKNHAENKARAALLVRSRSEDELEIFIRVAYKMPSLIEEMAKDLHESEHELVREFIIMPTPGAGFRHPYPQFRYNETDHPNAQNAVRILLQYGFVRDVTPKNWPVYRMTESFVELVKALYPSSLQG